jgi:lipopolysaccharide/colanic/teichoic acid biosynthesis glycosyltransferase
MRAVNVADIRGAPGVQHRRGALAAKRTFDIAGALLLVIVLVPLMLLISVAILAGSGRPLLFRQERVGRDGRRFRLTKFRTMIHDAEALERALWADSGDPDWLLLDHDPRVTPIGRVLRRLSLDELPQLWHVLTGEMSLVGPRPLSTTDDVRVPSWARARSGVRPGITGAWQVSGRTHLTFRQMLELDVEYVRAWSLWRDLQVLARTVPAVLTRRGAN